MNKTLTIFLLFFLLFLPINSKAAIIKNLSLYGGYVNFNESFKPAAQYGGSLDLITSDGIGFHLSASYLKSQSKNSKYYDLTLVPMMAGLTYHFFPYRHYSPYVTGVVCFNAASQFLDAPLIGYGLKVGFYFRMDKYSGLFIEGAKYLTHDNKTDLNLDPAVINAGLTLTLWGLEPADKKRLNSHRKELRSRRRRRNLRKKRLIEEELDKL
jgi:hypothetical protein